MTPIRKPIPQTPTTSPRRGGVIVISMVCLMLASFLVVHLAKLTFANRAQQRKELQIEQAAWLAEAGVSRAAFQLRTDPNYTGETWTLDANELGGFDSGQVTITVSTEDRSQVTVTAMYPTGSATSVRRTKTITMTNADSPASAPAVAEKPNS